MEDEHLKDMFDREKTQIRISNRIEESQYAHYRQHLVDWMYATMIEPPLKMSHFSYHCAVFYMDRILGEFKVETRYLQLIACACINLAVKMHERDLSICELGELVKLADGLYSNTEIFNAELEVLDFFGWRVWIVTAADFISYFAPRDTVSDTENEYFDFFGDMCLQRIEFCKYKQSLLAASQIYCTRKLMKLKNTWPEHLQTRTSYDYRQLISCADHIMSVFNKTFPDHVTVKINSPTNVINTSLALSSISDRKSVV